MKKFYVYRITNIRTLKHYYGSRGSENPKEDLGKKYFSSSTNKEFIQDQKNNPKDYKYKIIRIFNIREDALKLEVKLHNKFNVGINESFYNKAKQSSSKFDTTGKIVVKDKYGKIFQTSNTDKRYLSGELVHHSKGNITVKDKDGNTLSVKINDERYLSGELVGITKDTKYDESRLNMMKNKVTVKDKNGNFFQIDKNDERYLSGELVASNKGRKHSEETKAKLRLRKNPGLNKNKVTCKDIFTNEKCSVEKDTFEINKRYVGTTAKYMYLKDNKVFRKNDVVKEYGVDPRNKKHGYKQITLEEAKKYIGG